MSFDQLCVKTTQSDGSVTPVPSNIQSEKCISLGNRMIYAYERIEMPEFYNFISNKNAIPNGQSYGSGVITTSVKDGGISYYNAYFA